MVNDDTRDALPAIALGLALVLAGIAGVMLFDSLITGRELRAAARALRRDAEKLRDEPPPPAHTAN